LQKTIQENLSSEFTTTASVAGAGPYDLTTTAQFFANQTSIESPSYMNFMIKAYDSVYELDQISEMYQAAYQEIINNSFDGSLSGSEVDNILPASPVDLFQTEFLAILQNFDDGTASHPLKDAVALNDIYDWVPLAPTNLYHGLADETVPYSNSQTAFDTMLANGATDVTLSDCPISGHVACSVPYVLEMLSFFAGYAEDL